MAGGVSLLNSALDGSYLKLTGHFPAMVRLPIDSRPGLFHPKSRKNFEILTELGRCHGHGLDNNHGDGNWASHDLVIHGEWRSWRPLRGSASMWLDLVRM
jgi:hypothetical protein